MTAKRNVAFERTSFPNRCDIMKKPWIFVRNRWIMQKKRRSLWLRQASGPCLPDRLPKTSRNILLVITMHRSLDRPFLEASPDFYAYRYRIPARPMADAKRHETELCSISSTLRRLPWRCESGAASGFSSNRRRSPQENRLCLWRTCRTAVGRLGMRCLQAASSAVCS